MRNSLFKTIEKHCSVCGVFLKLNNSRDIERKKYCSHSCKGKANGAKQDMTKLWDKCNTPEANAKKGHPGKTNHKWIENRELVNPRHRYENKVWKQQVFARDHYTCVNCNKIGGKLHAHHKAPHFAFPKLRENVDNGLTFCEPCHKEVHNCFTEIFGGLTSKDNQKRRALCP